VPIIIVLQTTENPRAGGEFKGLILASAAWYEIFVAGFQFCNMYFFLQITQNFFIIPTAKKIRESTCPQLYSSSLLGPVFKKPEVFLFYLNLNKATTHFNCVCLASTVLNLIRLVASQNPF